MQPTAKLFSDIINIKKFNPYHGKDGRFISGGSSATTSPVSLSKDNQEYLRAYTAGKYDACCNISQEIEESGTTSKDYDSSDLEQTKQIMKVIDNQPVNSSELVRIESGYASHQVGDTITWGIRSTSRDTEFADKVLNRNDDGARDKLYSTYDDSYLGMTEYRIVGNKKSLDISNYSEYDQQESLVKGKFKVVGKEEIRYQPPKKIRFDEAVKDNPELKNNYSEFTSKNGNLMMRDNQTGQTYSQSQFDRLVYHNGKMIKETEFDTKVWIEQSDFKGRTVIKLEQVL